MNPQTKTGVSHLVSIGTGAMAMWAFMSSHAVDLYAIWDQIGVVYREGLKLIALVGPFASAAYAIWRTLPQNRLQEIAADPKSIQAAEKLPATPQVQALADALKK